jgi:hypothetical protein
MDQQTVWAVNDLDGDMILSVMEMEEDDHPVGVRIDGKVVQLSLTEAGEMCSALLEVVNSHLAKEVEHMRRVAAAASPTPPQTKRRGW